MKQVENGAASIHIRLSKGTITVKHGTEGTVLHQVKNAKSGSWKKIWNTLRRIESVKP